jgi:hypothetical protein
MGARSPAWAARLAAGGDGHDPYAGRRRTVGRVTEVTRRYGLGVGDEVFLSRPVPYSSREDSKRTARALRHRCRDTWGTAGRPELRNRVPRLPRRDALYWRIERIARLRIFSLDRILSGEARPHQQAGIYLLGVIRGHRQKTGTWLGDFGSSEADTINTGIAIATPIEDVVDLIEGDEDLKRRRREMERR